jgi:CHAT domain-containing protein
MALASNYKTASFKALEENKFFNPDQINLSSLNFAIEEIEYANQVFSGSTWMNQEATKDNFINNLNSAGVIHLGLHGLLNNDFPDQSGLVFHPKEGQEVEEFLLTSAEIYNLDINPAITILSACNSGAGKLNDGDGLRSIARSFIHAGSRSILMSLWEAPDVSTNQIIQGFYNNLEEGKTMSKALQDAKLNYIENAKPSFKHPKYWAHLVLVGNAPPLGSDDKMLYYLLPVLILVIGLFYFKRRS